MCENEIKAAKRKANLAEEEIARPLAAYAYTAKSKAESTQNWSVYRRCSPNSWGSI